MTWLEILWWRVPVSIVSYLVHWLLALTILAIVVCPWVIWWWAPISTLAVVVLIVPISILSIVVVVIVVVVVVVLSSASVVVVLILPFFLASSCPVPLNPAKIAVRIPCRALFPRVRLFSTSLAISAISPSVTVFVVVGPFLSFV